MKKGKNISILLICFSTLLSGCSVYKLEYTPQYNYISNNFNVIFKDDYASKNNFGIINSYTSLVNYLSTRDDYIVTNDNTNINSYARYFLNQLIIDYDETFFFNNYFIVANIIYSSSSIYYLNEFKDNKIIYHQYSNNYVNTDIVGTLIFTKISYYDVNLDSFNFDINSHILNDLQISAIENFANQTTKYI